MAAVGESLGSIELIYVTVNFEIIMSRNRFLGIAPPFLSDPLQTNCYVIDVPSELHVAIKCVI
jgi:hypothetical protein